MPPSGRESGHGRLIACVDDGLVQAHRASLGPSGVKIRVPEQGAKSCHRLFEAAGTGGRRQRHAHQLMQPADSCQQSRGPLCMVQVSRHVGQARELVHHAGAVAKLACQYQGLAVVRASLLQLAPLAGEKAEESERKLNRVHVTVGAPKSKSLLEQMPGSIEIAGGPNSQGLHTDKKSTRLNSSHIPLSRMP